MLFPLSSYSWKSQEGFWFKWRWITLWLCLLCLQVMCNSPNLTDITTRETNAALRPAVRFQDHPKQMLIQTLFQVSAFYSSAQTLSCFPAFISGQVSSRFIDKAMKLYVNGTTQRMDFWPLVFPKAPVWLLINVKLGKRDRGESLMTEMIYLKRNRVMPGNYDRILLLRPTRSLQNLFLFLLQRKLL